MNNANDTVKQDERNNNQFEFSSLLGNYKNCKLIFLT